MKQPVNDTASGKYAYANTVVVPSGVERARLGDPIIDRIELRSYNTFIQFKVIHIPEDLRGFQPTWGLQS